eukprot:c20801_g1_i1.p1 GENE.c20801_g1_i1~~c20801_g1_i1.p1  ORF type:complete len:395 (-),score=124.27 c20801_g1_i1:39-1223(-)
MEEDQHMNSIRVLLKGKNPGPVVERLQELVGEVLRECFTNLEYLLMLPANPPTLPPPGPDKEKALVVGLPFVEASVETNQPLVIEYDRLYPAEVKRRFAAWLPSSGLRDWYDVFLSYRWPDKNASDTMIDDDLAVKLFECFQNHSIGRDGRRVEVFLDRQRLEAGRPFDRDFVQALIKSRVAVPIVSWGALVRMATLTNDSPVDNLLLEWTVMVELQEWSRAQLDADGNGRVFLVQPIFVGRLKHPSTAVMTRPNTNTTPTTPTTTTTGDVQLTDFFQDKVKHPADTHHSQQQQQETKVAVDWLPEDVVVDSVVERAGELLSGLGVTPSLQLPRRTVKGTVKLICKNLGVKCDRVLADKTRCTPSNDLGLTGLYDQVAAEIFNAVLHDIDQYGE